MAKSFEEIFSSFGSLMHLLRDEKFIDLLENYERAKKTFLVGYEIQDEVSSITLFEAGDQNDLKPEDYLLAFSDFVKEKENEIEAVRILLSKPKAWNTEALTNLRKLLSESDFNEAKLQRAHKLVYKKDLVDIISMIKHAVKKEEPLFSVDERVDRAIKKVLNNKQLTYEQLAWIDYIKEHLKQNLTIGKDDFEAVPVLEQHGGWTKFRKLFKDNFEELLLEINENIAA